MRGIILEGVSGSGKTTLFAALQRRLPPAATKLVVSEHYTDRWLEEARKQGRSSVGAAIRHIDGVMAPVRLFAGLEGAGKFAGRGGDAGVYVLFERFLGSHLAYLGRDGIVPTEPERARIAALYAEVAGLGLRLVIVRLGPDVLPRAVLSTRAHRSPDWRRWLDAHGDDAAITAAFTAWQDALLTACRGLDAEVVDARAPWDPGAAGALAGRLAAAYL